MQSYKKSSVEQRKKLVFFILLYRDAATSAKSKLQKVECRTKEKTCFFHFVIPRRRYFDGVKEAFLRKRQRLPAAVHGSCTASTRALYSEYMAFVLRVQSPCTDAMSASCLRKTIFPTKKSGTRACNRGKNRKSIRKCDYFLHYSFAFQYLLLLLYVDLMVKCVQTSPYSINRNKNIDII